VVDLGTGDGRSVTSVARRHPGSLVIGVDADAASMREASRKAARPPGKGGLANAMFIVSSVASMPTELDAVADEVRISFPWGSLLRGVFGVDAEVLAGIGRVAKLGAEVRALVSITARDGLAIAAECRSGRVRSARPSPRGVSPGDAAEIAETNSSWARRLKAGVDRPVTLLRSVRVDR
jgi:16S rRNA (adenine(1408)-N(1))-methyltransferase